ncbi:MAG: DUF302 domain-containing protein [Planctomycetota bacterium]
MLYVQEARGSVEEVAQRLAAAAASQKFGVLETHDLREKMNAKGVAFTAACLIFEICNPVQARKVLEADMSVSTALPCRISLYEEGGKVKVVTILPTAMLRLFGKPELEPVALEVERAIVQIMDEACR